MSTLCQGALIESAAYMDKRGASFQDDLEKATKAEEAAIRDGKEYDGPSSSSFTALISMYGGGSETCKGGAFALQNQQGQTNSQAAQ